MPKVKSHKGLLKRIKITGTGKIKHRRRGKSHLNSTMSSKRTRALRQDLVGDRTLAKRLERVLHRRLRGRNQGK